MAPLVVFVVTTAAARLLGLVLGPLDGWPESLTVGLAVMFAFTATAHFVEPRRSGMAFMVPPRLPGRAETWVAVTGVLEALGALGLLLPATRTAAAICLALLLVAMFPANVQAARTLQGKPAVTMPLWARGLVQLLWIAACLVVAIYA